MTDLTDQDIPAGRLRRLWELWRRSWQWQVIVACAVASMVLGYVGFLRQATARGEHPSFLTLAYLVLELFTVQSGLVPEPVPWELDLARFLAPAVSAWTAVKGLAILFRDQLEQLRLRHLRNHVVICGLGRKGLALAEDFRGHGDAVVAIESDEENDNLLLCPDLGIISLVGDATEPALLRKARAEHARHIVIITGDDGVNMTIAVLAYQLVLRARGRRETAARCFVHIVSPTLRSFLARQRLIAQTDDLFDARFFDTYQNSARLLLREHPLDRVRLAPDDPRSVHLIVIGLGQMGEGVLLQAAHLGHYANGRKLRVTVLDRHAEQRKKRFHDRYPQFDRVCEATFVTRDAEDPERHEEIRQWAADENSLTTIAVCLDSDPRGLSCVLGLLSRPGGIAAPIFVRMAVKAGPASLFEGPDQGPGPVGQVHAFGMIDDVCTRDMLLGESLDLLARKAHEEYVAARRAEGRPADEPALQSWERLAPDLKESYRRQIDHIPVKLRAVGCQSAPAAEGCPAAAFTDEDIEVLARMEHARWRADRLLGGWTLGSDDSDRKTCPDLCDWDQLPETAQRFRRESVLAIPHLLGLVEERVCRR